MDYAFLFRELTGPEKRAVAATKKAVGLYNKVVAFELAFERAGVKHYDSRMVWAEKAQHVWREGPEEPVGNTPDPTVAQLVANVEAAMADLKRALSL